MIHSIPGCGPSSSLPGRRRWLCVAPTALCLADHFLNEADPLRVGALASAVLTILWLALFNPLLVFLPLRPAKVLALAIALGHALHAVPLSKLGHRPGSDSPGADLLFLARSSRGSSQAETAEDRHSKAQVLETRALRELQDWQWGSARSLAFIGRASPPLLWLEQLTLEHRRLAIDGRAFHPNAVASFLENLDRVPWFSEPELLELHESADGTYAFSLGLYAWAWRDPEAEGKPPPSPPRPTPRGEVPGLQAEVCALLARSGLPVEMCVAGTSASAEGRELSPALVIRLEPASYDDVVRLLDRLGRLPRLVVAEELAVTPDARDSRRLAADLVLVIPVARRTRGARAVREPPASPASDGDLALNPGGPFWDLRKVRTPAARGIRPPGIAGLLIDEVHLLGLLRTGQGNAALVRDFVGATYLLRPGDGLYDGDVVSVSRQEVVFRQIAQDPTALKPFREVVRRLPSDPTSPWGLRP